MVNFILFELYLCLDLNLSLVAQLFYMSVCSSGNHELTLRIKYQHSFSISPQTTTLTHINPLTFRNSKRNKWMEKLICSPNDEKQNYPFFRINLLFFKFGQPIKIQLKYPKFWANAKDDVIIKLWAQWFKIPLYYGLMFCSNQGEEG